MVNDTRKLGGGSSPRPLDRVRTGDSQKPGQQQPGIGQPPRPVPSASTARASVAGMEHLQRRTPTTMSSFRAKVGEKASHVGNSMANMYSSVTSGLQQGMETATAVTGKTQGLLSVAQGGMKTVGSLAEVMAGMATKYPNANLAALAKTMQTGIQTMGPLVEQAVEHTGNVSTLLEVFNQQGGAAGASAHKPPAVVV